MAGIGLNLFAAVGLAFAVTAVTTFVAESESLRGLVIASLLFGTALFYATLAVVDLQATATLEIGVMGFIIGLLFSAFRLVARRIVQKH